LLLNPTGAVHARLQCHTARPSSASHAHAYYGPKHPSTHPGSTSMALLPVAPRDHSITSRDAVKRGSGDLQRDMKPSGSENAENTTQPHLNTEHTDYNNLRETRTNTPGSAWGHTEMAANSAPHPTGSDERARDYKFKHHLYLVHLHTHRPNTGIRTRSRTTAFTDTMPDGA
jgi:hypothetical protein